MIHEDDKSGNHRRLISMAATCFVLWICILGGSIVATYRREKHIIRSIEAAGGNVQVQRGGPDWLRKVAGDELMKIFDRVSDVELYGPSVTDAELPQLGSLTFLSELALIRTGVTDAGLVHLRGLRNVDRISLSRTGVTDAGLVHLIGLPTLRQLDLYGTGVTDAGMAHLRRAKNLRLLNITGTSVTAQEVELLLKDLPQCQVLGLADKAGETNVRR